MQFRLVYRGRLPAQRHKEVKHEIRREIHRQLVELWKRDNYLEFFLNVSTSFTTDEQGKSVEGPRLIQPMADENARCGYRFVPLIGNRKFGSLACALDILFLRRDKVGIVSGSGGDIDNRIKVLFDALKMPQGCDELPGPPEPGEDPFFCLLSDDNLITEVKVTTDQLLLPVDSNNRNDHHNNVELVIHVRTIATGPAPQSFL